jgi:xylulokinase
MRASSLPHPSRPPRRGPRVATASSSSSSSSSSPRRYALGLDVGTQGTKALLVDVATRRVAGRGSLSYGLLPAPGRPGAAEQDPAVWIGACASAIADALADAGASPAAIAGVGVSGQQHGMVCLDARGDVVRPAKLWCDTESAAEAAELAKTVGWSMQAGFTASKALWLKRNEPDAFDATATMALPHDFVNFKLTGALATDAGDASGVGTFDLSDAAAHHSPPNNSLPRHDASHCAAVDARFASMLPEILPADAVVGVVSAAGARLFGLPRGIPVSIGSGDNMMAALGAGCVSEGTLVCSLGTSGTLFGRADAPPRVDPSGSVAPFRDAAGGYLPLLCTLNCTRVVEEAREVFGAGRSHDELGALAAEVSPGCDGVRFLPYLVGERTPNWPEASGALVGLRPGSLGDPGVAYRAAMEGATYGLVAGVEKMRALGLKPPKRLVVVGGGARSRAWRQIVADAFGAEVRRPAEAESAALGAATQALAALEGAKDLKAFVEANPPEYLEEVEVAAPERTAAHEANRAEFEREGKALFG